MNDDFIKYLFFIVFIVIAAVVVSAVFILNRKRRAGKTDSDGEKKASSSFQPVSGGNVSIFFDKQGNATIIPYVTDLTGSGKATSDVVFLYRPFKAMELGNTIRNALASCRDGKPADSYKLMERLGEQNWKKFSEGKLNLSVYFKEGIGMIFNTTVRTPEGAYVFNKRGVEFSLTSNADDETIGSTALQLLNRCR